MAPGRPHGAIVLAAFAPAPELFRAQLLSLQNQTVRDWECIVSVDGERAPVAALVAGIVGDDPRFRVIGDDARRGFYLNFERGLEAVGEEASWVALCDQDDRWDEDKLERLLPHLAEVSLVSGQARLVSHPSGEILGTTGRRDHGPELTLLVNQFTGSFCVLDRAILATALPFPRASTSAAAHDHWLAVVAGAHRGTRILGDVVQDYVQHDANVFGDPSTMGGTGIAGMLRTVLHQAKRFEGSRSPRALLRMAFWVYVGWRQLMADTLRLRRAEAAASGAIDRARRTDLLFGAGRRWRAMDGMLRSAVADGVAPRRFATGYRVSWVAGALSGGRRAAAAQPPG